MGRVGVPDGPRGAEHRIYSGLDQNIRTPSRASFCLQLTAGALVFAGTPAADSSETESRTQS